MKIAVEEVLRKLEAHFDLGSSIFESLNSEIDEKTAFLLIEINSAIGFYSESI